MKNIVDLEKYLNSYVLSESCIGVHGLSKSDNFYLTAQKILNEGLNIRNEGGLNTCCTMLNKCTDLNRIFGYNYAKDKNDLACTILIAIPETMDDINGDTYYIGPFDDIYIGGNEDRIKYVLKHPFNAYINILKKVPKEFIVGAYIKEYETGKFKQFIINTNYIGLMSYEEQVTYFESIKKQLTCFGLRKLDYDDLLFLNSKSYYCSNLLEYLANKDKK